MKHTTLGRSGPQISRIAMGCMSFGDPSRGYSDWSLDDQAAQPFFEQAVELGINFWDTTNVYGFGTSERSSDVQSRGPTKPHHLADAVAALDVELTGDEITALETPYTPHAPTGF